MKKISRRSFLAVCGAMAATAADKVAEDTDGHVKVTIYPSSKLGG